MKSTPATTGHSQTTQGQDFINILLEEGFEGLPKAAEMIINAAMLLERIHHLHAQPHQRAEERDGHANGFKPRTLDTALGRLQLAVPQVRGSSTPFRSSLFEQGSRTDRALKCAIAEMYLQGVSTRRVTNVLEELCGLEITSTQVSRLTAELDAEFKQWRERPLPETAYIILDATYLKVRRNGSVQDTALLSAIGIRRGDGRRTILGVSCALSEAEPHWRDFLRTLKERGVGIPDMITSDAHEGIKAALRATFNATPWQRCQFHLQQNAQAYVPTADMKVQVAADIRSIFNAENRAHAEERLQRLVQHYQKGAPKLAAWMEKNIPEGLTVFELPEGHRKRLRTSNMCERLHKEIKRRTRVAGLFPNEASALRLASAIHMEISEEWETGKAYLSSPKQANS